MSERRKDMGLSFFATDAALMGERRKDMGLSFFATDAALMGERRKDMGLSFFVTDAALIKNIDFSRFMVNFASPTFKIAVLIDFNR